MYSENAIAMTVVSSSTQSIFFNFHCVDFVSEIKLACFFHVCTVTFKTPVGVIDTQALSYGFVYAVPLGSICTGVP